MYKNVMRYVGTVIFLSSLSLCGNFNKEVAGKTLSKDTSIKVAPSLKTEILWDKWGVPHIYAKNDEDAFRAFAWSQMESHSNLLLMLYAKARGRSAEYYLPSNDSNENLIQSDRAVRIMGLYDLADQWYKDQSPEFKSNLTAFAAGINAYAMQNSSSLDDQAKSVLPITGVDVMAHSIRVLYLFSSRISRLSEVLPVGSEILGSNGWAIAPSRSASGKSLLLANPHLKWSDESVFYEAHVNTPGYNTYGATLVGFPVLIIAFNDHLGWTHTVNTIDGADYYEVLLKDNNYIVDGQSIPLKIETQKIKIKQSNNSFKEETLLVRRSIHGPVVEKKDGKTVAVRFAGIQTSSFSKVLEQWWKMGRATKFDQFQNTIKSLQIPLFNIIYADVQGNIMLLFGGQIPVRSKGDAVFWSKQIPGDTSVLLWTKVHGYDDLPKAVNPASGWVQNSNDVPWFMTEPIIDHTKYPAYMSPPSRLPGVFGLREQRGIKMIKQDSQISLDELIEYKHSTRNELADRILPDLINAANQHGTEIAKRAARVLGNWDRETNADSRGAVLFGLWFEEAVKQIKTENLFKELFDLNHPLETPRGLKDPHKSVELLQLVATRLEKLQVPLDIPWGEIIRFRRGMVNLRGNGGPSDMGIFRTMEVKREGKTYNAIGGDSFIAAVEFSRPLKAKVLMTYGNSSNPNSPHFSDQLLLAADKQLRTAWRTRSEIEANLEATSIFVSNTKVVTKRAALNK